MTLALQSNNSTATIGRAASLRFAKTASLPLLPVVALVAAEALVVPVEDSAEASVADVVDSEELVVDLAEALVVPVADSEAASVAHLLPPLVATTAAVSATLPTTSPTMRLLAASRLRSSTFAM
jgi:hypothetical protein